MSRWTALSAWEAKTDTLLAHNATVVSEAERHLSGTVYMSALHQERARTTARRKARTAR